MKKTLSLLLTLALVLSFSLVAVPMAGTASAAGTHSATEPTWYYQGIVASDTVKMKHVTVVYDPLGLAGVTGNPKFMMWWGTSSPDELYAQTSNDGKSWTVLGKLAVNFPSTTVPVYHPEVIYDRLGFEDKKSAGDVHFKMWFYDGGYEGGGSYNWMRYAESADGVNWQIYEDSPDGASSGKNYLEFSGGSGNEMSVLYKRGGTGIVVSSVDREYVGYQATNNPIGISTDGAWFFRVDGQGGGPTDVCREMLIAAAGDTVDYRAWDDLPSHGDVTSWDSATGLSWNSPAAGNAPISGASWSDFYGAMSVVVVGDRYYMYDTMDSDNYKVGLLIAPLGPPTEVWVDDNWTSQANVNAFDPSLIWQYDAFNKIQDGIDAVAGSTVHVAAGTYNLAASIKVDKSISIIGDINNPENVVIDAGTIPANSGPKPPGRDRDAFQVVANNVVIKGFKIINALNLMTGAGDGWQNAGITVGGDITLIDWLDPYDEPILIDGGTFSNNIIEDCSIGIYLAMSKNVIVSDNIIRYSTVGSGDSFSANAGVGIMNWNSKAWGTGNWQDPTNNVIERNVVEYSDRQGICLGAWGDIFSVSGTVIRDNIIRYSGQWGNNPGIDLMYVTGPLTITGNDIYSNPTGIGVGPEVSDVEAHCNNIYNNTNFGANVWDWTGTASLDATRNWWGDDSGPYHATLNSGGLGDPVSDNVSYDPWTGKPGSDSTTTGTGNASFAASHGCIADLTAVPTPPSPPVELPHGVFSFNVTCIDPGQTVTLTVTLPGSVPVGTKWWKYYAGSWYSLPIGSDNGDNIITVTLTDGVFPGDTDSIDGQITDDGGPGYHWSLLCRGLIISSTEGGRVTKPGEGHYFYDPGTIVKLVATPDDGYSFVEWTGDVRRIDDVNAASTTITMDYSYVIIANFVTEETSTVETEVQYELTVSSTIGGSVTSPGEGTSTYEAGTVVNLVASPDDGYDFVNWTGDGITSADSATTSVTMNGDYTVKATFGETTGTDSAEGPSGSMGCFIATAAYGTPTAEQIDVLREFRDVVLLENSVGSEFVALYYRLSPPVADFIAGNSFLKTVVRELLVDPVVWIVEATGDIWRN